MYGEPAHKFVTEHLSNPAGKILLDIGCGTGDEATEYERIGFAAVHGIDQSQQMVERTKAAVAHPENFRQGVYEHIPFPDQSLDVVVGNWSIHYVVDLDSAYRELARVLRPGGRLVLAARHPDWDAAEPDHFWKNGHEYVRGLIYGKVPAESPVHTKDEYFSPVFYSNFEIEDLVEQSSPAAIGANSPFLLLAFSAIRKAT